MEKTKKPFYKKWWFWVFAFLFMLVMGNLNTGNKTKDAPEPKAEAETVAPQTVEDQLTTIIDSLHFKYSDLEIITGSTTKISLHYDKESWDETRFCQSCLTDYINLCKQAYALDGIDKVEYYVFVNLTDPKGNETSEKGFSICMSKDVFNTYNWDNLEYVTDSYNQIASDCEFIDIHAGIEKNVDFSKVFYKG